MFGLVDHENPEANYSVNLRRLDNDLIPPEWIQEIEEREDDRDHES